MIVLKKLGGFFKKLGFDKGDERSVLMGAYAVRIAWVYTSVALLVWTLYEEIRFGFGSWGLPALLFFTSQVVFWSALIYYRKRMGG